MVRSEFGNVLVHHCARMLASPHSVSENGAPAAGFIALAEGAIDYRPEDAGQRFCLSLFGRGLG
jgi:hypothetical protein